MSDVSPCCHHIHRDLAAELTLPSCRCFILHDAGCTAAAARCHCCNLTTSQHGSKTVVHYLHIADVTFTPYLGKQVRKSGSASSARQGYGLAWTFRAHRRVQWPTTVHGIHCDTPDHQLSAHKLQRHVQVTQCRPD